MRRAVLQRSDAEGLARDDTWSAGSNATPPLILTGAGSPRTASAVYEVLDGVVAGQELGVDEIVCLLEARGPEVVAVAAVADDLRRQIVGDTVTFVRNRNINYTNVCTFKCRFCAFSKGPLSLNLRGDPYLLGADELRTRVEEAVDCGATEVCLQGGIHPDFDGDYYLDVIRLVKSVAPSIHVHGFTALEVTEGARRNGVPLAEYLAEAKALGLATLPGTAAEILDDEVRAIICPDKINTEEWLDAHRTAHSVGLRSNVTIMFGHVEQPVHVARHMVRTRTLQHETGGFTEFVPLPFVHMATPLFIKGRSRMGPTFREALLMHAVGRIAYRGAIDNIQVSWVKLGLPGAQQVLQSGANDLGGTLMDENISRAAGASHGQEVDEVEFRSITEPLGRPLEQRTTLYGRTTTVGHRLRPAIVHSDHLDDELEDLLEDHGRVRRFPEPPNRTPPTGTPVSLTVKVSS
jgi:FO synthase